MINYKKQGKKNKAAGRRFELKVRKDLESKGWHVSKYMNNVSIDNNTLIPAKHRFRGKGIPMAIGTGFPDFIAIQFEKQYDKERCPKCDHIYPKTLFKGRFPDGFWKCVNGHFTGDRDFKLFENVGVEVKSNGYLTKEEKEKCKWLLENNKFSKIFIASKGKKRGEIIYEEFKTT